MSSASWIIQDNHKVGAQAIDATDTTQNHPLGTIVRATHATYGEGEFIYLLGVASTAVGNIVSYDAATYQTALLTSAVGISRPAAVAMSANVGSQYGWYQISGNAVVSKGSGTSFAAAAALSASSGNAAAAATTNRLTNAVIQAAAVGTSAVVTAIACINRPSGPASD